MILKQKQSKSAKYIKSTNHSNFFPLIPGAAIQRSYAIKRQAVWVYNAAWVTVRALVWVWTLHCTERSWRRRWRKDGGSVVTHTSTLLHLHRKQTQTHIWHESQMNQFYRTDWPLMIKSTQLNRDMDNAPAAVIMFIIFWDYKWIGFKDCNAGGCPKDNRGRSALSVFKTF